MTFTVAMISLSKSWKGPTRRFVDTSSLRNVYRSWTKYTVFVGRRRRLLNGHKVKKVTHPINHSIKSEIEGKLIQHRCSSEFGYPDSSVSSALDSLSPERPSTPLFIFFGAVPELPTWTQRSLSCKHLANDGFYSGPISSVKRSDPAKYVLP